MHLKQIVPVFVIALGLAACVNQEVEIPSNVIPKDTLVEMLAEIQLFESMAKVKGERNQLTMDIYEAYEVEFEKYHTTQEQFTESMRFYAKHQKLFEEIYDQVIVRLTEMEAEFISTKTLK